MARVYARAGPRRSPAGESAVAADLEAVGFVRGYRGFVLRR